MARFIATSIDLPTVENSAITMIRSGSKLYSICEFQGMHKAYFYWQIEFNNTFPIKVRGLNRPQIDISPWDGTNYRVRLTVTHKGQSRYLEADNTVIESIEKQVSLEDVGGSANLDTFSFDSSKRDELISSVAARFKLDQNQDHAHNAIITFLLDSKETTQDDHLPAYEAIKRGLNHPLYHVRKSSGLRKVENSDFFIRDFLMLHTQGGESARDPITLKGISIRDGAINSKFQEEFDLLVDEINDQNFDAGLRTDVSYFDQLAHRDGLQLIPRAASLNQFMGATMSHVSVRGNTIESNGALQGIFASDGAFRNLHITHNRIRTAGAHTISIAGMLSGKIDGNIITSSNGGPTPKATLYPLRIGGGANIKILSFANNAGVSPGDDNYYEYEAIEGDQEIEDLRRVKPLVNRGTATYWHDVDLPRLQQLYPATYAHVKRLSQWPHEIPRAWDRMMQQVGVKA